LLFYNEVLLVNHIYNLTFDIHVVYYGYSCIEHIDLKLEE